MRPGMLTLQQAALRVHNPRIVARLAPGDVTALAVHTQERAWGHLHGRTLLSERNAAKCFAAIDLAFETLMDEGFFPHQLDPNRRTRA